MIKIFLKKINKYNINNKINILHDNYKIKI